MKFAAHIILLAAGSLALLTAVPCRGADNKPALDAILRFVDAIDAGDANSLREVLWIGDANAQRIGRDSWISLAVAQKALEQAAAKFGEEGAGLRCNVGLFLTPADRKALDSAIIVDDDVKGMRVFLEGDICPLRLRRSPAGQWQVVLDLIEEDLNDESVSRPFGPDAPSQIRIDRLNALAGAFTQVADKVKTGELATAGAAESDLAARVAEIDRQQLKSIRDLPDRYRWLQGPW